MARRVLVTEALDRAGMELLEAACEVTMRPNPSADELADMIGGYDALVVRSATPVTAEVLAAGSRLAVVGRAGTGVDNIDVDAATRRGIVVVNAPTSNTVAVAEHTMALMLALARHVTAADLSMHCGRWEKKGLMGTELRDKVLGIVGLGRVGISVATRAQGFEMRVIAYDPFVSPERAAQLNIEMVGMDDLLRRADYVSLHTPSTERTRGIIGARELAMMKPTAQLINCARGDLIVEEALIEALERERIAGAALDVFADEPEVNPALCGLPNLILTPHLGASTEEAQSGAALQVARQVVDVLEGRPPRYPVNVTAASPEEMGYLEPYVELARHMGRFYAQYASDSLTELELTYGGEIIEHDTGLLTAAALVGLLAEAGDEPVNMVNARLVARERGLMVREVRTPEAQGFADLLTLRAVTRSGEHVMRGTVMRRQPHIVCLDDYWIDFVAAGVLLVSEHVEQPGVIGQMGTLLGKAGMSISFVQVGREARGGRGLMVVGLDDTLSRETIDEVRAMPSVRSARVIRL
jgi:D-3-phosphoglycerate dehydrogenase